MVRMKRESWCAALGSASIWVMVSRWVGRTWSALTAVASESQAGWKHITKTLQGRLTYVAYGLNWDGTGQGERTIRVAWHVE